MPKIVIFDDDTRKIALGNEVLQSLNASLGVTAWSYNFCQRIDSLDAVKEFLATLRETDILVVLDIEIKNDKEAEWRSDAATAIAALLDKSEKEVFQIKYDLLKRQYGDHIDYQLSLMVLAVLSTRRVPVITISTKANDEDVHFIEKARACAVSYIPNWSESWQTSWTDSTRRKNIISGIATCILKEWEKKTGEMDKRIWCSARSLDDQQDARRQWFKREMPHDPEHPVMKHDWNTCTHEDYFINMRAFLDNVINKSKEALLDFPTYEITQPCHEAVKSLIGAVSNADYAMQNRLFPDTVPQLNSVVLLAAAWDPNAAAWFPTFGWQARFQLMRHDAGKQELRAAILAIGGEEGLFHSKLIDKDRNTMNNQGKWEPHQSTVEGVDAAFDTVTIRFKFQLSKVQENFRKAKRGESYTGGTTAKLVRVWEALKTSSGRTVDVDVQGNALLFKGI